MIRNCKIEFDFSGLSSSSSHNKACDAWGPPCHATMYSSSLLLNIPTLIIIHLFLQSRRWIAFTRQTILNDFRKWNFRWHFVYNICTIVLYTYSSHYDDGPIASMYLYCIYSHGIYGTANPFLEEYTIWLQSKRQNNIEVQIWFNLQLVTTWMLK